MAWKDICALSLLSIAIILALPTASASSDSLSDLKATISGFDDPRMDTEDLAFFLASHGFDATRCHAQGQLRRGRSGRPCPQTNPQWLGSGAGLDCDRNLLNVLLPVLQKGCFFGMSLLPMSLDQKPALNLILLDNQKIRGPAGLGGAY